MLRILFKLENGNTKVVCASTALHIKVVPHNAPDYSKLVDALVFNDVGQPDEVYVCETPYAENYLDNLLGNGYLGLSNLVTYGIDAGSHAKKLLSGV